MVSSDPLYVIAGLFPFVLTAIGLGFVLYAAKTRTPADVESDVLAALSTHEALPIARVCERPPLNEIDRDVVHFALEHLRRAGRAVRWYADDDEVVYRRVA